MNKFMTRMYAAQESGESPILDQIFSLIDQARSEGSVDTNDLKLTKQGDGSINIHDKTHNENTIAKPDEAGGIKLVEEIADSSPELEVGQLVSWKDKSGNACTGKLIEINGGLSQVQKGDEVISVSTDLLNQMNSNETHGFSSCTASRRYLVDEKNNIMAFGYKSSLGKLAKDHPNWRMLTQYDFNAFKRKLNKRFSNLSEENQKIFTRQNRRFAILNGNKLETIVDIDNVKGILNKNPGWTAMRETEYNRSIQKKFSNMSESTKKLIKSGSLFETANQ